MRKFSLLLLCMLLAFIPRFYAQNIAINELGLLPDTSALLDLSSTTKGFLAPRMTTSQQNTLLLPANGLMIFNTTENTFKVNRGTPAAPNWTTLGYGSGSTTNTLSSNLVPSAGVNTMTSTVNGVPATAPIINSVSNTSTANILTTNVNGIAATGVPIVNSNALSLAGKNLVSTINGVASAPIDLGPVVNAQWNLSGNTGTTAGPNFLGTIDNADFIFKTNNIEAMRLTGPRRLLGLNVSNPIYRIQVEDPGGPDADIATRMYNASNQGYFPSMQLQVSAGTKAAPLPVTSGTILGALHFVGYDGSTFADVVSTGIVVKTTQNWTTGGHGAFMSFKTIANSTVAEVERMKIDQNGNVGIATTAPGSTLDVKGTFRLSGVTSGYVGFTPPAAAGSTTYTLPGADGTLGQLLTTNGTGLLSWSSFPSTAGLVPYTGATSAVNLGTNNFVTTGSTTTSILSANGNTTLGTTTANTVTIKGSVQGANALVFDGATTGGNMTTLAVADPTAANLITLPNTTGTLMTKVSEDLMPSLGGNLSLNNKSIDITAALNSNRSYVGSFETAIAGEALVFGDVLYLDFATNKWRKANAGSLATTPVQRMALENIAANGSGKMLIEGFIREDTWSFGAAPVYLSATITGAITTTQPATSGNQVQRVGIAFNSNKLHFKPSMDVGEL